MALRETTIPRIPATAYPGSDELASRLEAENAALTEALRASEERFALFMSNIPSRCALLDEDSRIRYCNGPARVGDRLSLRERDESDERPEPFREVLRSGVPVEREMILAEGEERARRFLVRAFKVGQELGCVWTDVTDRRLNEYRLDEAEAELRALAGHIIDAREEERASIARELHDELGQTLTAIDLSLRRTAREYAGTVPGLGERMEELRLAMRQAVGTVQRVCSELRPAALDRLGLRAALEGLAGDFGDRRGLPVEASLEIDEETIGPKAATAIFRIAQEALTNVVRHARASRAWMALRVADGILCLRIRDDGVGIGEDRAAAPESFGLRGIQERARSFGGRASIGGKPGVGTELEVRIPIGAAGKLP